MNNIVCNPMNLPYKYQIKKSPAGNFVYREAADPTMVVFKGNYLLFASMSGGFWYSSDLCSWQFKPTPELPINDYAPDVREVNGAVIFSASKRNEPCTFFKCSDPINASFEPVNAPFVFWDPDIFADDDGRVYFYWGCTNTSPLYGVEMNPETFEPIGETIALFGENEAVHGWERSGENNKLAEPKTDMERIIREKLGTKPFIEGAFMTKHNGKYYLQYAAPATECNVYSDGVYVGENPLGPFTYQAHNPFSSKPGGFIRAAGHGSTFQDLHGNWWHVSSMCIGINEGFERRLGLFPCDFDSDGIMWCNQHFADYPMEIPKGTRTDMLSAHRNTNLLSYNKEITVSSFQNGFEANKAADENAKTWWAAKPNDENPYLLMDLGEICEVSSLQINFADHEVPFLNLADELFTQEDFGSRHILVNGNSLEYIIECSSNQIDWQVLADTTAKNQDLPHNFIALEATAKIRYIKVTNIKMPLNSVAAISGIRVFGKGNGSAPTKVENIEFSREKPLNILLSWQNVENATGYNIRYGIAENKLYSSWQITGENSLDLSMVNGDTGYYIAIDSYNENGVTLGDIIFVKA